MPPKGAQNVTEVSQPMLVRAAGAVMGAIKGASSGWFSPLNPLSPAAPPEVRGRQFDYPVGYNLSILPRSEPGQGGVDFGTLRAVADPVLGGFDLVRLAIETVKDRLSTQEGHVRGRDGTDGGDKARKIELALRRPDGIHTFRQWMRMVHEDLLVVDSPIVYLAPSIGGQRIPQVMDGALLKPLIALDGRSPSDPQPAYHQVIKGLPAVQYTRREVVCMPRNLRSNRTYGCSPVEQIITTINIALRRQVSQLEYYTAGSIPDMLASVPQGWDTKQIGEFQSYWDALMSGNTEERRRLRFVPGDMKPYECKSGQLKDEYDEWLARIVCYAFNLSPQALVKSMNRATAQTAQQTAQEEGLEPLKLWQKDFLDEVIEKAFDGEDLEWVYSDEEITDPLTKAQVTQIATGGKAWLTADEAREGYGYEPLTTEQKDELSPQPSPPTGKPGEQLDLPIDGADKGAEVEKLAKSSSAGRSLRLDRPRPQGCSPGCACHAGGGGRATRILAL